MRQIFCSVWNGYGRGIKRAWDGRKAMWKNTENVEIFFLKCCIRCFGMEGVWIGMCIHPFSGPFISFITCRFSNLNRVFVMDAALATGLPHRSKGNWHQYCWFLQMVDALHGFASLGGIVLGHHFLGAPHRFEQIFLGPFSRRLPWSLLLHLPAQGEAAAPLCPRDGAAGPAPGLPGS